MAGRQLMSVCLSMLLAAAPAMADLGGDPATAEVIFDDGGYHVIDELPTTRPLVIIRDSIAGDPTTVEFVSPVSLYYLQTYGSSRGILTAGSPLFIEAWNDSDITMNVGNGYIAGYDNSSISIAGGQFCYPIRIWGRLQFAGGIIEAMARDSGLRVYGDAQVEISGGTIVPGCFFQGTSQVHISGGGIWGAITTLENSHTTISGGYILEPLCIGGNSTVTLEGHGFWIDGSPAPYGTYYSSGFVTGSLTDGRTIFYDFMLSDGGTLSLAPKPGDANGDGSVDGLDYVVWSNHYGQCGLPAWSDGGWAVGNLNDDDCVDGLDYVVWSNNYDVGSPGTPGVVPEPATLSLLALGGLALIRRKTQSSR